MIIRRRSYFYGTGGTVYQGWASLSLTSATYLVFQLAEVLANSMCKYLNCHPESFDSTQDKFREGSQVLSGMANEELNSSPTQLGAYCLGLTPISIGVTACRGFGMTGRVRSELLAHRVS